MTETWSDLWQAVRVFRRQVGEVPIHATLPVADPEADTLLVLLTLRATWAFDPHVPPGCFMVEEERRQRHRTHPDDGRR